MGVPALFSNVVKKHSNVIKTLNGFRICERQSRQNNATQMENNISYDNLYLDSNSIVYDCVHKSPCEITDDILIANVCKQIHHYIELVKPKKTVIIAFDGVAPVAKLENQRNRRYKTEFTSSLLARSGIEKNSWDTTAITPGTPFMTKLDKGLNDYFKINNVTPAKNKKLFGVEKIIVSSSMEAGEGEHKIFEYIRNNLVKHENERTVIYGLDADLIMLSINHLCYCPSIFLFRETPHFIRSLNRNLDPGQLYTLDISELFEGVIENTFNIKSSNITFSTYDYVFLVSLLGNDYIPHNPAFNIRTGGLELVLSAYRASLVSKPNNTTKTTLSKGLGNVITNGETIHWAKFRMFIEKLAEMEEDLMIKEHKHRDALERKPLIFREENDEESIVIQKLNAIPIYNREREKYIEPTQPYWEERYYKVLFGGNRDEIAPVICKAYMEALEWTMKYYTNGCPDWRWAYPYSYAPLFSDLVKYIPTRDMTLLASKPINPVSPLTQLSYVLPMSAHHMLPVKLRNELYDKMGNKYSDNWGFEWSYCRYFWECHAKMPSFDIEYLERCVSSLNHH